MPTAAAAATRRSMHASSHSPTNKVRANAEGGGGGAGGSGGSGGGGGGGGGGGSGDDKNKSSGLALLWAQYLAATESDPIKTKVITSGILNAVGDLIAQTFFNPDGNGWDVVRTLKFTFLGAALVGPGLHYWYGFLNRLIPSQTVAGTISRVAVDQFVWAPVFISAFLSSLLTLSGEMSSVPSKLKNDLWATCKANWLIWIPFQVVNFGVIPPNLQVAAANVCALVWNTYLSWQGARPAPAK